METLQFVTILAVLLVVLITVFSSRITVKLMKENGNGDKEVSISGAIARRDLAKCQLELLYLNDEKAVLQSEKQELKIEIEILKKRIGAML
jgi:hypothetical protein